MKVKLQQYFKSATVFTMGLLSKFLHQFWEMECNIIADFDIRFLKFCED